jgi:hypothetical protein
MQQTFKSILCALTILFAGQALAQSKDHEAVKATLDDFLRAYTTGEGQWMRKAFRGDGAMLGHSARDNKVLVVSGEALIGRFDGKPANDEALRKRRYEILDVSENTAMAKVVLDYPRWDGTDYLALAKIEGQWLIVSKSYSGKLKPQVQSQVQPQPSVSSGAR